MKTRKNGTRSLRVPGEAILRKYVLLISTLLVLCLLSGPAAARSPTNPAGGGPRYTVATGPLITISEPAHLIDLMDPGNAAQVCGPATKIMLAANINMAAFPLTLNAPDTTPGAGGAKILGTQIGTNATPFQGVFQGNGFVISNLTLVGDGDVGAPPDTADGLFGVVQRAAAPAPNFAIRNLILVAPSVVGYATDVGGLVGRLERGIVYQCAVLGPGDIQASGNGTNVAAGGLVGHVQGATGNAAIVDQCFVTCDVHGPTNVGGLVGRMTTTDAVVRNSFAAGHLVVGVGRSFDNVPPKLGGLVGLNNTGAISGCYADCRAPIATDPGIVTAFVGALVGEWNWAAAAIIPNFSDIEDDIGIPPGTNAGQPIGLNGGVPIFAAPAFPPTALTNPATFTNAGWALGVIWTVPQPGQTPRLLWRPF